MMTKKQKKLMAELRCSAEGPVAWDFATVDVDAIKLALAEIYRLKERVNLLLDARLSGGVRFLGRDDLKKEVIE